MTHLPYLIPAYVLGVGIPVIFGLLAWQRLASAKRRLAAIDPRGRA